jgi:peroxiredoxin Q/BCP
VIGVSRDTQEVSDHFRQSLDLPYPLLGDPDGLITLAYKVRWPLVGLTRRATFVIDARRTIRLAFQSEFDPDAHVTEVSAFVPRQS